MKSGSAVPGAEFSRFPDPFFAAGAVRVAVMTLFQLTGINFDGFMIGSIVFPARSPGKDDHHANNEQFH